jgi:putative acetyltransferase
MSWTIESAEPSRQEAILSLVNEAFTSPGRVGQEEVDIVVNTWERKATISGLELVAVDDDVVVGHVLGGRGDLGGRTVVAVAPLSVASARQGKGIGTALMEELLLRAEAQGWPLVVLLGDPGYYGRFGFEASGPHEIYHRSGRDESPYFQVRRMTSFDRSLRGEFTYCWEM